MRSGYKKTIQDTNTNNEPYLYRNYYKKLWHIEAPSKVKITNWKGFNNFIPNLNNLAFRRLGNETTCPIC